MATSVGRRAAVALLALAGCDFLGPKNSDGGELLPVGIVYGTAQQASGAPVINARVNSTVHRDTIECRSGLRPLNTPILTQTDSLGRYRSIIVADVAPERYCVNVQLLPPGGDVSSVVVVGGGSFVQLQLPLGTSSPDSVRVDVRVP